jgi:hypothetical protein
LSSMAVGVGRDQVLVEQPGVLATLSRWRSRVQIPSGTLGRGERLKTKGFRCEARDLRALHNLVSLVFCLKPSLGTVRKLAKRRSSNLRVCGFDSRLCHLRLKA